MPNVACKICGQEFYVKKSHLLVGWGKYCSRSCHHKGMQLREKHYCFICSKEIYKTPTQLKRSKSLKFFCGKSCQTKWRNTQYVGPMHLNWKDGRAAYRSVMTRNNIAPICFHCNSKDKRVLAVHHINENHLNNNVKNLAWVCHNCHYLVHNDKVEKQKFLTSLSKK